MSKRALKGYTDAGLPVRASEDAICAVCQLDHADDACSVCGSPICRECYRTCVKCKALCCPECATGVEIADGLIDDACPKHVKAVMATAGKLDEHPDVQFGPTPIIVPNTDPVIGEGGYIASWPSGPWRWCGTFKEAAAYTAKWFETEEGRAA